MRLSFLAAFIVLLMGFSSCKRGVEARPHDEFTLVLIKTGPKYGQLSQEENRRAFDGHFSNMIRMANDHQMVLAGPYGENEEGLQGLFVMNTANRDQAMAWASTDPAAQAGVFELEYHKFETHAPMVALLDRVLEIDAKALAEGKQRKPGDGARSYVIVTSEQLGAEDIFAPHLGNGVLLRARIDRTRALAVLDATNVADAKTKYAAKIARVPDFKLYDWFATDQLMHMSDL